MEYSHHTTNDVVGLAFQTSIPIDNSKLAIKPERCIILMHGFSGSSEYFTRNFKTLSEHAWIVAPDMRGHGRSERSEGGYHVARLAADLRELVKRLNKMAPNVPIVPVGCSIGAAVLWTYIELFGCEDFSGFVFVDQAPLQDRSLFGAWDETKAHTGCYDEATMLAAQQSWIKDSEAAHIDLVNGCLGYRHAPEPGDNVSDAQAEVDLGFFTQISEACDQTWLARLLADHTRYDHREAIELITKPTLVMAGRRSGCFPLKGMLETVARIERVRPDLPKKSVFDSGHWLFYEEPERFNREIIDFAQACGM